MLKKHTVELYQVGKQEIPMMMSQIVRKESDKEYLDLDYRQT